MFQTSDPKPKSALVRPSDDSIVRSIRQEILQSDLRVKALVQDIRECGGPTDVLNTLNTRVAENMKWMKKGIEELETIAREQDRCDHGFSSQNWGAPAKLGDDSFSMDTPPVWFHFILGKILY